MKKSDTYLDTWYDEFVHAKDKDKYLMSLFEEIEYLNHELKLSYEERPSKSQQDLEKENTNLKEELTDAQFKNENYKDSIIALKGENNSYARKLKLFVEAASRFDLLPKLKKEISKIKDEEKNIITFKKFFADTSTDLDKFADDLDFDEKQKK